MKTDYFEIMVRQAQCSVKAAELLEKMLRDYQPQMISKWRQQMHAIEHSGDEIRHDALRKLAREFITPIERDDLISLIQILDDVTDAIDEIVIELYMFNITVLPPRARELADMMLSCVRSLERAVEEFRHYKKSEKLMPLIIEVNSMEGAADEVYIDAMRALFTSDDNSLMAIGMKAIYDCIESCCDLCEHAADVIESTVMNNT